MTTTLLGDIKAIKMLALPQVASRLLTNLRANEIKTSKTFRELLVATLMLCMHFNIRHLSILFLTSIYIYSHLTNDSCSSCNIYRLHHHISLLDPWIFTDDPGFYLYCSDRLIDRPCRSVCSGLARTSAVRGLFRSHPKVLQLHRCESQGRKFL